MDIANIGDLCQCFDEAVKHRDIFFGENYRRRAGDPLPYRAFREPQHEFIITRTGGKTIVIFLITEKCGIDHGDSGGFQFTAKFVCLGLISDPNTVALQKIRSDKSDGTIESDIVKQLGIFGAVTDGIIQRYGQVFYFFTVNKPLSKFFASAIFNSVIGFFAGLKQAIFTRTPAEGKQVLNLDRNRLHNGCCSSQFRISCSIIRCFEERFNDLNLL